MDQPETPKYATVLYGVMDELEVSIAEYVVLDMIHKLSFRTGYCYKRPISIAADLRLTKRGVNKMIARLIEQGLLERLTDNALRVTDKFTDSLTTGNKVPTKAKKGGNSVPQSGNKVPKVGTQFTNNRGDNNNNNNKINNSTNVELAKPKKSGSKTTKQRFASKEHEEISKMYYDCIKIRKLPVLNHTVLQSKIKQMTTEDDFVKIKWYLAFIATMYEVWDYDFKPQLNNALDIYSKRMQIMNAIRQSQREEKQRKNRTLHL